MKKTKAAKAAEYFLKYPNATPKDVGARFSMHLPQVYAVRKRVLSGSMLGEVGNPQVTTEAATQTADLQQVGGNHYKDLSVQPWSAMESWMTPEQFAGFLRGNAIKYLARCDVKGGIDDIKKARHYIDKLVEVRGNDV
jgi:hypothetical protein